MNAYLEPRQENTMPRLLTLLALVALPVPPFASAGEKGKAPAPESLTAVPFQEVRITDSFWGPRLERNRTVTIEANLRQCEVTGCINNFAVAGKLKKGKHRGLLFYDSD